jgi:hypothetical protein
VSGTRRAACEIPGNRLDIACQGCSRKLPLAQLRSGVMPFIKGRRSTVAPCRATGQTKPRFCGAFLFPASCEALVFAPRWRDRTIAVRQLLPYWIFAAKPSDFT